MGPDFKPSQVYLWRAAFPLIATFDHAETEFAAALIVIACKSLGDVWQPVTPQQVGLAMREAWREGGEMHHLASSPILLHPDMRRLASDGYAAFLGDPDAEPAPAIRFTAKGFERLRANVRPRVP